MFSTFHLVALEVKLQTTLGKSTFKSHKTLTSPVATGEGESPDESSALEELPVEVHFPIANRGKLDKLEDRSCVIKAKHDIGVIDSVNKANLWGPLRDTCTESFYRSLFSEFRFKIAFIISK